MVEGARARDMQTATSCFRWPSYHPVRVTIMDNKGYSSKVFLSFHCHYCRVGRTAALLLWQVPAACWQLGTSRYAYRQTAFCHCLVHMSHLLTTRVFLILLCLLHEKHTARRSPEFCVSSRHQLLPGVSPPARASRRTGCLILRSRPPIGSIGFRV